mgnify:CR=1 FL=1
MSVLITNNLNEAINIEGYIKNLGSHQNTILSDESYKELISNSKIFNDLLNNKYITCIVNDKITFTIKYVEEDWEIATYRQGHYDFNKLFTREDYETIKEQMTGPRKKQFFFIKPLTEEARQIILNMDFNALAERNTATPGFGKGDFVSYYVELKNQ